MDNKQQIRELDKETWNNLVGVSEQGSIFVTTKWLDLYQEPYVLYGYYKGNELAGGLAGFVEGDKFINMKQLTPFMGIVIGDVSSRKYTSAMSLHSEVASRFTEFLSDKFASIQVANHYTFPDIRQFLWHGYTPQIKYTYVVDITQDSRTWLESDTRYEINKCIKACIDVEVDTMQGFLEKYKAMWERKGMEQPLPDDFYYRLAKNATNYIYQADGAGVVILYDNKRAYYILGASIESGNGASSYCLWQAIKESYSFGIREIDLVGCNDEKIGLFKRGFGGTLKPYYLMEKKNENI